MTFKRVSCKTEQILRLEVHMCLLNIPKEKRDTLIHSTRKRKHWLQVVYLAASAS